MITQTLVSSFFGIIKMLLETLTPVNFIFPIEFIDTLRNVLLMVAYFLPLDFILPLLAFSISIDIFNVTWKLILRFKSFIPTMGG